MLEPAKLSIISLIEDILNVNEHNAFFLCWGSTQQSVERQGESALAVSLSRVRFGEQITSFWEKRLVLFADRVIFNMKIILIMTEMSPTFTEYNLNNTLPWVHSK